MEIGNGQGCQKTVRGLKCPVRLSGKADHDVASDGAARDVAPDGVDKCFIHSCRIGAAHSFQGIGITALKRDVKMGTYLS